ATATTHTYTLSLHDALPICSSPEPTVDLLRPARPLQTVWVLPAARRRPPPSARPRPAAPPLRHCALPLPPRRDLSPLKDGAYARSEEHTSELQSRENLVCRL